jgi:prolipoprotein diacylglyceryltransferase
VAVALIYFGKRLKPGQSFAAYVVAYCFGRLFIELIRIDAANTFAGVRVNVWVSMVVGVLCLAYFLRAAKERPKS